MQTSNQADGDLSPRQYGFGAGRSTIYEVSDRLLEEYKAKPLFSPSGTPCMTQREECLQFCSVVLRCVGGTSAVVLCYRLASAGLDDHLKVFVCCTLFQTANGKTVTNI